MWKVFLPNRSNNGFARSTCSAAPPTMILSVFAWAPSGPPIGASRKPMPCLASCTAMSLAVFRIGRREVDAKHARRRGGQDAVLTQKRLPRLLRCDAAGEENLDVRRNLAWRSAHRCSQRGQLVEWRAASACDEESMSGGGKVPCDRQSHQSKPYESDAHDRLHSLGQDLQHLRRERIERGDVPRPNLVGPLRIGQHAAPTATRSKSSRSRHSRKRVRSATSDPTFSRVRSLRVSCAERARRCRPRSPVCR